MNKDEKRVTEAWFPGAHSDLGGGFSFDGLPDIALYYLIQEFKERGLDLRVLDKKSDVDYSGLRSPGEEYQIDVEDVYI